MSDPRGFMKHSRFEPEYRPVQERLEDFAEVVDAPDEAAVRREGRRCMDCGVAFCHSDSGCPLGNLIPEWNELAAEGRWAEAVERLHATNNFPEFTSRLCPAPCESACVLGLHSEPVNIKSIERLIVDKGFELGLIAPEPAAAPSGFHVAVIGSGPAGLACAQQLARSGHAVTVFERARRLGGLLRYGIPDFKMDKGLIDRRVKQLAQEGVRFRAATTVGVDVSFSDLESSFDAVALATGAEQARDLQVPGRELRGIHFAMDYLVAQNRAGAGETVLAPEMDARGKSVIILGGGDTGSDCLGTALRQGAREVKQFEIMPRPPEQLDSRSSWPEWPLILRSSHAHEEGGEREWCVLTKEFLADSCGGVRGLLTERVKWQGGVMHTVSGAARECRAEMVILALGFSGPAALSGLSHFGVKVGARGLPEVDRWQMTSSPGVFAAGDLRRGASLIVWAIAEGRRMAAGIERFLNSRRALDLTSKPASP